VNPGASVGTLHVANNVTLGGKLLLELNRTNAPNHDVLISDLGTITYGGTLTVTNIGEALQVNDTFQLFPSAVTAFGSITIATTDATGAVYTWTNKVAVDGSITVLTVVPPVSTTPPTITYSVSGDTLNLSWPPDHKGWRLLTNAVGLLATNSWFQYPSSNGSADVTNVSLTIDRTRTNLYFRLIYP
jgi:hypothetical protein